MPVLIRDCRWGGEDEKLTGNLFSDYFKKSEKIITILYDYESSIEIPADLFFEKWSQSDDSFSLDTFLPISEGFTEEQARGHMEAKLPTLDYWKRYEELSDAGQFDRFKEQLINEINELHNH